MEKPFDRSQLIHRAIEVYHNIQTEQISLIKDFPDWGPDDLRRTTLNYCEGVIGNLITSLHMAKETLYLDPERSWLKKVFPNAENDFLQYVVDFYTTNLSNTTFITFFSLIEAEVRQVARHVYKTDQIQENFGVLYKDLFKKLNIESELEFFDFARTIRNCMHTNMIYVKRNKATTSLTFKGKNYDFVHGKVQPYDSQDMFLSVMEELFLSATRLVRTKEISSIKEMGRFYEDKTV